MSERKFTDEEIIAVVKRCASPVNECEGCPFEGVHRGDRECFNVATDELIEIASRQKKELAVLKQSGWISVEERLPDAIDSYIVVVKQKYEWEAEWEYDTDVAIKLNFAIIYNYIEEMKRLGIYDDATIVITGDHANAVSDYTIIGGEGATEAESDGNDERAVTDGEEERDSGTRVTSMFFKRSGDSETPLATSSAQVSQD